jgi:hypothetical protein
MGAGTTYSGEEFTNFRKFAFLCYGLDEIYEITGGVHGFTL